jgi:hypothetical protein
LQEEPGFTAALAGERFIPSARLEIIRMAIERLVML